MLNKTIARIVFYLVALTLLGWTASLTVAFLTAALPNVFWLVPILGLVVFDGGMVAWLLVYLNHAEGNIQRAVALVLTVFDLIGVGLMVIAEILLDGQQFADAPETLGAAAVWGIGVWTVVNVAGLIGFHLGDPAARKAMAMQAEKDAIWEGALDSLKQRRIADEQRLARELSEVMFAEMLAELRADNNEVATSGNSRHPHPAVTAATAVDIRALQPLVATPVATPVATVATDGADHPNG